MSTILNKLKKQLKDDKEKKNKENPLLHFLEDDENKMLRNHPKWDASMQQAFTLWAKGHNILRENANKSGLKEDFKTVDAELRARYNITPQKDMLALQGHSTNSKEKIIRLWEGRLELWRGDKNFEHASELAEAEKVVYEQLIKGPGLSGKAADGGGWQCFSDVVLEEVQNALQMSHK